jgi:hypothetical protein
MELDRQKNFYDTKRYFQGKDHPTQAHPEPTVEGPSRAQIGFGLLFLAFLGLLFWLRVSQAQSELVPTTGQPAAPAAPAPAKH